MHASPIRLMIYGFLLLLVGFLAAFGMVVKLIDSSFFVFFASYAASIIGLILGLFGVTGFTQRERRKGQDSWDNQWDNHWDETK